MILDTYDRRARLSPALIIALPVSAFVVMLFASRPSWLTALIAVVGASGATYLVVQLVRYNGRLIETSMWDRWGGAPTTDRLRYRTASNVLQIDRRHRIVAKILTDEHIPSRHDEGADPRAADDAYIAIVSAIRARTRSHKDFNLLFQENCNYGFRRNLYASKWYAYSAIVVSLVACVCLLVFHFGKQNTTVGAGIVIALNIIWFLILRLRISEAWVRDAADSYADRLFEAAETLAST